MKLNQNWRIIFGIATGIVLLYLTWLFRQIIIYVLIAALVSLLAAPLNDLLKKIHIRRFVLPAWLRSILTLFIMFSSLILFILLFAPLVQDEITVLSAIDVAQIADQIDQQFHLLGYSPSALEGQTLTEYMVSSAKDMFSFNWMEQMFSGIFGVVGHIFIGICSVLFIAFFFIKDGFLFTRIIFTVTPDKHLERMKKIMDHSYKLLRSYFVGLAIQSAIMAVMVGVSLSILGIKNALLIGMFAGIANVIPYIGAWMAAIFGALIALTTSLHLDFNTALLPLLVKVILVFVIAQQIDGLFVQPLVLGNSVKAHPLEIFIVVLAAGIVGGITGMIVAIPVYTLLRIIAKEFLSEFKVVESLTRDLTDE